MLQIIDGELLLQQLGFFLLQQLVLVSKGSLFCNEDDGIRYRSLFDKSKLLHSMMDDHRQERSTNHPKTPLMRKVEVELLEMKEVAPQEVQGVA